MRAGAHRGRDRCQREDGVPDPAPPRYFPLADFDSLTGQPIRASRATAERSPLPW